MVQICWKHYFICRILSANMVHWKHFWMARITRTALCNPLLDCKQAGSLFEFGHFLLLWIQSKVQCLKQASIKGKFPRNIYQYSRYRLTSHLFFCLQTGGFLSSLIWYMNVKLVTSLWRFVIHVRHIVHIVVINMLIICSPHQCLCAYVIMNVAVTMLETLTCMSFLNFDASLPIFCCLSYDIASLWNQVACK